jgi:hypothetical protein
LPPSPSCRRAANTAFRCDGAQKAQSTTAVKWRRHHRLHRDSSETGGQSADVNDARSSAYDGDGVDITLHSRRNSLSVKIIKNQDGAFETVEIDDDDNGSVSTDSDESIVSLSD